VSKTHGKAASHSPFNSENDNELAAVIGELKALANVVELDDQSKTNEALRSLGVHPRAAFTEPNKNILTCLRKDGDKRYLFLYNYMYTQGEAFSFGVTLEGAGKPRRLNCWTGEAEELGLYARDAAHTTLNLTLSPGEAALFVVDTAGSDSLYALSTGAAPSNAAVIRRGGKLALKAFESGTYTVKLSDGTEKKAEASVPENIPLKTWDLEVEDWDEGEKKTIVEDRGLGIVTKEVYYETKKTRIPVGKTELKPWREIPALGPAVSGVGCYKTSFTLPVGWTADNGALLCIGSTNGNSAAVYVNGKKAPAFDFNYRKLDITALLVPGENSITVEVSSTLNNRLLARNYPAIVAKVGEMMAQNFSEMEGADEIPNMMNLKPPAPQDYGMTGEVKVLTYTIKELV
ncbi:MAG: hypothetical protein LBC57_06285, partial [Treponema sp.]|nr:hypothetical protein [Treponema sp.]